MSYLPNKTRPIPNKDNLLGFDWNPDSSIGYVPTPIVVIIKLNNKTPNGH